MQIVFPLLLRSNPTNPSGKKNESVIQVLSLNKTDKSTATAPQHHQTSRRCNGTAWNFCSHTTPRNIRKWIAEDSSRALPHSRRTPVQYFQDRPPTSNQCNHPSPPSTKAHKANLISKGAGAATSKARMCCRKCLVKDMTLVCLNVSNRITFACDSHLSLFLSLSQRSRISSCALSGTSTVGKWWGPAPKHRLGTRTALDGKHPHPGVVWNLAFRCSGEIPFATRTSPPTRFCRFEQKLSFYTNRPRVAGNDIARGNNSGNVRKARVGRMHSPVAAAGYSVCWKISKSFGMVYLNNARKSITALLRKVMELSVTECWSNLLRRVLLIHAKLIWTSVRSPEPGKGYLKWFCA